MTSSTCRSCRFLFRAIVTTEWSQNNGTLSLDNGTSCTHQQKLTVLLTNFEIHRTGVVVTTTTTRVRLGRSVLTVVGVAVTGNVPCQFHTRPQERKWVSNTPAVWTKLSDHICVGRHNKNLKKNKKNFVFYHSVHKLQREMKAQKQWRRCCLPQKSFCVSVSGFPLTGISRTRP